MLVCKCVWLYSQGVLGRRREERRKGKKRKKINLRGGNSRVYARPSLDDVGGGSGLAETINIELHRAAVAAPALPLDC